LTYSDSVKGVTGSGDIKVKTVGVTLGSPIKSSSVKASLVKVKIAISVKVKISNSFFMAAP
jgi:hypothetical protein